MFLQEWILATSLQHDDNTKTYTVRDDDSDVSDLSSLSEGGHGLPEDTELAARSTVCAQLQNSWL